jgi:hypothetical protein
MMPKRMLIVGITPPLARRRGRANVGRAYVRTSDRASLIAYAVYTHAPRPSSFVSHSAKCGHLALI